MRRWRRIWSNWPLLALGRDWRAAVHCCVPTINLRKGARLAGWASSRVRALSSSSTKRV